MTSDIWNGNANWTNPANWSLGVPGAGSDVLIQTGTVALSTAATVKSVVIGANQVQNLFITGGAGGALTAATLTNFGNFSFDTGFADGGGAVTVSGAFANYNNAVIGNGALSASATVTVGSYGSFPDFGSLTLVGNQTLATTFQTSLIVNSAAPSVLLGRTYLHGDSLLQYASGAISTLGGAAVLQIVGQQARVNISGGSPNSALQSLVNILGTLDLEGNAGADVGGVTLNSTGALFNAGQLQLDIYNGDGASAMAVSGALTNSGALTIGNSTLSASTTLTVTSLINQGSISLWGNQTPSTTLQATLNILAAAPTTWTGNIYLHGDSDVVFNSGGIVSIAANSLIQINGQQSRLSIGANTANTALNALASNYGTFDEEGDLTTGPGGASVTTSANFTNYNIFQIDVGNNDGASTFTDSGLFTNNGTAQIGNDYLSANTTLTVNTLANNGTLYVDSQRNSGANPLAAVYVQSAAPSASTGYLRVAGDSLIQFASGAITSINAGAGIELDGNAASILTNNGAASALATLTSNSGTLLLRGANGFGTGAVLATSAAYTTNSLTRIDYYNGDGGSVFTTLGALTISGEMDIGNQYLAANTTVNATSLNDMGTLVVQGSASSGVAPVATLAISGAALATVTNFQRISGQATLSYGSGNGYTNIGAGGFLELDGQYANIKVGAGGQNSGIGKLSVNQGTLLLRGGAFGVGGVSATTTVGLTNSGTFWVDYYNGDGGSALTLGGTLTNYKNTVIGNQYLSANTTVNAANLINAGSLTIQGATGALGVPTATLNIAAAPLTTVSGFLRIGGAATLNLGAGTGFKSTNAAGFLELDGALASVTLGAGPQNSGLAGFATNAGTLLLRGNSGFGQGGVTLTTSTSYVNSGTTWIDYYNGDGGDQVTFGATLNNQKHLVIGNGYLSANTTVNATSLINTGDVAVQGNYYNASPRATLALSGGSINAVSNSLRVSGTATLSFGSGFGFTSVAAGGFLELDGAQAQAVVGAGGPTSALANLSSNAGTLLLRGNSNLGQGSVTIAVNAGFTNTGTTDVDYYNGDGGSSLSFNGSITNQGTFWDGNAASSGVTTVSAKNFFNLFGQVNVYGGGVNVSKLALTGGFANYAGVYVNAAAEIDVTGGYSQYGGVTTLDGALSAAGFTQYSGSTTVNGTLASTAVNDWGASVSYNSALTALSQTTSLTLRNGGVLKFHNSVSSSQTVTFQDATDTLQLFAPPSFSGNVAGFVAGDFIDLMGQSSAASVSYAGGVLSVLDGGSNVLESFHLTGGAYTTASFSLVDDLNGGKLLFV